MCVCLLWSGAKDIRLENNFCNVEVYYNTPAVYTPTVSVTEVIIGCVALMVFGQLSNPVNQVI